MRFRRPLLVVAPSPHPQNALPSAGSTSSPVLAFFGRAAVVFVGVTRAEPGAGSLNDPSLPEVKGIERPEPRSRPGRLEAAVPASNSRGGCRPPAPHVRGGIVVGILTMPASTRSRSCVPADPQSPDSPSRACEPAQATYSGRTGATPAPRLARRWTRNMNTFDHRKPGRRRAHPDRPRRRASVFPSTVRFVGLLADAHAPRIHDGRRLPRLRPSPPRRGRSRDEPTPERPRHSPACIARPRNARARHHRGFALARERRNVRGVAARRRDPVALAPVASRRIAGRPGARRARSASTRSSTNGTDTKLRDERQRGPPSAERSSPIRWSQSLACTSARMLLRPAPQRAPRACPAAVGARQGRRDRDRQLRPARPGEGERQEEGDAYDRAARRRERLAPSPATPTRSRHRLRGGLPPPVRREARRVRASGGRGAAHPEGHALRHLFGIDYPVGTCARPVESAQGKIGTLTDQVLLFCFHPDPAIRRYSAIALNSGGVGGVLT